MKDCQPNDVIQNGDGCELELISGEDESDHKQSSRGKVGAIEVLKAKLDQGLVKDIESLESTSA